MVIFVSKKINPSKKILETKGFVEKPDFKTAQKYVKSKKYLWNSGIFCFNTDSILSAFQKLQPKMWQNSLLCSKKTALNKKTKFPFIGEKFFC